MKITKQGNIKAPIEVVFNFMTDIELYKEEFRRGSKEQSFKLNYDRKNPFGVGNRIVFSTDTSTIIITIAKNDSPNYLSMSIEPNKRYLDLFGTIQYDGTLEKINEKATMYNFIYESNKKPRGLLKFIFMCFFHVSFYFTNKRIKKTYSKQFRNEQCKRCPLTVYTYL